MSKYLEIKTEFKNLSSLKKALVDIGFTADQLEVAPNPAKPSLTLYGYRNDARAEKASLRIDRKYVGSASNDVGFAWNGKSYTAIISQYDSGTHFTGARLNQLRQRYSVHEVKRQACMKGYTVQERQNQDGTINLVLTHR